MPDLDALYRPLDMVKVDMVSPTGERFAVFEMPLPELVRRQLDYIGGQLDLNGHTLEATLNRYKRDGRPRNGYRLVKSTAL